VSATRPPLPQGSREARLLLGALLVVVAAVVIVTSGESVAVRYLLGLVTLDITVRLVNRPEEARPAARG
jgi:hypothetical protein